LSKNLIVAPAHLYKDLRQRSIETDQVVSAVSARPQHSAWPGMIEIGKSLREMGQRHRKQITADENDSFVPFGEQGRENLLHARPEVGSALRKYCKPRRHQAPYQPARINGREGKVKIGISDCPKTFELVD